MLQNYANARLQALCTSVELETPLDLTYKWSFHLGPLNQLWEIIRVLSPAHHFYAADPTPVP